MLFLMPPGLEFQLQLLPILSLLLGLNIVGRIVMGSAADRVGNRLASSLTLFWLVVAKESLALPMVV